MQLQSRPDPSGRRLRVGAYLKDITVAILTPNFAHAPMNAWVEEPHFEPGAIRRAIEDTIARPGPSRQAALSSAAISPG